MPSETGVALSSASGGGFNRPAVAFSSARPVEVSKAKGPAVLHDGGGLYLRVSESGSKSWVFRFQIDGKRRDMGLGSFPDTSLADARNKAHAHRQQRGDGT